MYFVVFVLKKISFLKEVCFISLKLAVITVSIAESEAWKWSKSSFIVGNDEYVIYMAHIVH